MRRKDKEIVNIRDRIKIINRCKVCRLGLSENNQPYVVPLNYGYSFEEGVLTLFFHGARNGKKVEVMKNNNRACFEIDCDNELIEGEIPCKSSYVFKSVIGFGEIVIFKNEEEKNDALKKIMKHQTGREMEDDFTGEELKNVMVYKMEVKEFTGKQKEFPMRSKK
ncbi:MAG: pyridoxamine 5'-phosphate oxidase family protein [Candidatus Accumulibacter sp.]|jgi:nitroimidazol reductase NimA-like FMN-containing flavoprotein (pyridoxamine 5'-phosphate oxidase superfamily)|nr:pyridoxamine 5'-phosphate oxidase family protein [Accumulibacter sp.]